MKKTILFFLSVLISSSAWSQNDVKRISTPKGLNYKALVSENGTPVANSTISVKVKLKDGATELWYEEHTNVHTDANGIFSINIGEGTRISGSYTHFQYFNWNTYNDVKMDVEIDTGSGYQTLVSNEALKYVPYAKNADISYRALYASHLSPQTDYGIQLTMTDDLPNHGYILNKGSSNFWHIYLNGPDYVIRHNTTDVMKIKDATNTIYMLKPLEVSDSGIVFDTNASGTGNYYFINSEPDGLAFRYNSGTAIKLHGSASVEIPGKITAPTTGNNNLKPLTYGSVTASGGLSCDIGNVTVTRFGTGIYDISVTGVNDFNLNNTVVIATLRLYGNSQGGDIRAYVNAGNEIRVRTYNKSGVLTDRDFQFVIYKK